MAVQHPPREAGIDLAGWNWKVVRRFVAERFGITLARSSCRKYLHRLGFVVKRPTKRLLKADEAQREAFVADYFKHTPGAATMAPGIDPWRDCLAASERESKGRLPDRGKYFL